MTDDKKSDSDRLRDFYDLWAKHVDAGGDQGDEAWKQIATACGVAPPPRAVVKSTAAVLRQYMSEQTAADGGLRFGNSRGFG